MVRKQEMFVGLGNLVDHDAYYDVIHARAGGGQFVDELFELKKCMEQSHAVDIDYSHFLLSILTLDQKFGPIEKRKKMSNNFIENDNDCYIEEEENDPQYELFLENLKEHEKSYAFQFERAGSPVVIKYERESSLDEECDSEPTSVEMNENLTPRKSKKEVKNLKIEAGKCSTSEMVSDLDYLTLLESSKFVDDYFVCTFGGGTIVYEKDDMKNNLEKLNSDDEHSSDVEILDVAAFHKEGRSKSSVNASPEVREHSRFRQELLVVLRKPYDKEEHNKLLRDIKIRKQEERHMDLRGGRERSCATAKVGKSYIDRFPDLRKQLLKFQVDGPKCLNLLRGFFFWLQKFLQDGSFEPWMDAECLAISPEVCHPGFSPKRRKS